MNVLSDIICDDGKEYWVGFHVGWQMGVCVQRQRLKYYSPPTTFLMLLAHVSLPHPDRIHIYHHIHVESCPSASLDYVIEPWFLGPGSSGPGGPEFKEWADASKANNGTVFGTSIKDLPDPKQPRCALISGRTADNPKLFTECIAAKCSTIFLEKPGAPTVKELQQMRDEAEAAGVDVLMGYNKVNEEEDEMIER